jgi:hypothetical protein
MSSRKVVNAALLIAVIAFAVAVELAQAQTGVNRRRSGRRGRLQPSPRGAVQSRGASVDAPIRRSASVGAGSVPTTATEAALQSSALVGGPADAAPGELLVPGQAASPGALRRIGSGVVQCFVPYCTRCQTYNPYLCAACGTGYQLTASFGCQSCARNYEQNLDVQTFQCVPCPDGYTSNGGVGAASQCEPITTSTGRRLFADLDDAWA